MNRLDATNVLKLCYANWPHGDIDEIAVEACFYTLRAFPLGDVMTALQELLSQPHRTGPVNPAEIVTVLDARMSDAAARQRSDTTIRETEDYELYQSVSGDGKQRTYRRCSKQRRRELDEDMVRRGFMKERIPLDNGNFGFRWIR